MTKRCGKNDLKPMSSLKPKQKQTRGEDRRPKSLTKKLKKLF